MIATLSLTLLSAAAVGGGAILLRILGAFQQQPAFDKCIWSFVLGTGVFGWLMFFSTLFGLIDVGSLSVVCLVLIPGLFLLRAPQPTKVKSNPQTTPLTGWDKILLAGITIVIAFDFLEGLSPPTDADSLAYHFAIPKLFLEHGKLEFIPRANDGGIPLLQQMTYVAALGLGGEQAMTLWAMLSGWGAGAMLYWVVRRHVPRTWALASALVFLTTPAIVYAAGSGQVEVRNAMFVLVAAAAVAEALRTGQFRYVVLAGIAAGFFVASKYPGLLFAFSCGLALMFQRRWFVHGLVFSLVLLVAGGQWYAWNWWHTGDPVFPLLFTLVDSPPSLPWNPEQHAYYSSAYKATETILPVNILSAIIYPVLATLFPHSAFESTTTGLGPFMLLVAPVAIVGAAISRRRIVASPLLVYAALCLAGYLLWFFLGPSQRIRFHIPIYPLALVVLTVAAARAVDAMPALKPPMALMFLSVICVQGAGHGLFTVNHLKRFVMSEARAAFLSRNVGRFPVIEKINQILPTGSKILLSFRELVYLSEIPVFYAHPMVEARIELRPNLQDIPLFWSQLKEQSVTHIISTPPIVSDSPNSSLPRFLRELTALACVNEITRVRVVPLGSRSLPSAAAFAQDNIVFALTPKTCQITSKPGTFHEPTERDLSLRPRGKI